MSGRIEFDLTVTDHSRAARFLLATLKGDKVSATQVLDEVAEVKGAVNALLFALADFGVRVIGAVSGEAAEARLEASLLSLLDQELPPPETTS